MFKQCISNRAENIQQVLVEKRELEQRGVNFKVLLLSQQIRLFFSIQMATGCKLREIYLGYVSILFFYKVRLIGKSNCYF